MKVYIGPYKNWIGPYQIAGWLNHLGVSSERCDKIGECLSNTWIASVCKWIDSRIDRKIKIRIDKYDTWNMHDTLALIIVPMLKQLSKHKQGSPLVDDEDVPEHLRATNAPSKKNEWDIDDNHHLRWDWVLGEMIWAFEQQSTDWESQFFSGEADYVFEKINNVDAYEMKTGPSHSFTVDQEGLEQHQKRIDNGTRLFGKYYKNLWD
jgi:hypothetical protein